jgi:hypothetical protein
VLLNQLDDFGLLGGRASAANDGGSLASYLDEHLSVVIQAKLDRGTVNYETSILLVGKDVKLGVGFRLGFYWIIRIMS